MKTFEVLSVNISRNKGERKTPVKEVMLRENHGIAGDAHAGGGERQVSLLAQEDVDTMIARGARVGPGDFAENVTTRGVDLSALPLGTRIQIGPCEMEVSQIGKVCHDRCAIFEQVGACVMPDKGVFVKVVKGGVIEQGSRGVVLG